MGNIFSAKEQLYVAVDCQNTSKITKIIKKYPELLNTEITVDCKISALGRASWRGNLKTVELLVHLGAQIDYQDPKGVTALMWACKGGHAHLVQYYIESNADLKIINPFHNFNALDYSIVHGNYECGILIVNKQKELILGTKSFEEYKEFANKNNYRWVNYELFIDNIMQRIPYDQIQGSFFEKPKKQQLQDPVIDPREDWSTFIKRNLDFEQPPMVERSELPIELQPQNRFIGQLAHYIHGFSTSPQSAKGKKYEINDSVHPIVQLTETSVSNKVRQQDNEANQVEEIYDKHEEIEHLTPRKQQQIIQFEKDNIC